MEGRLTEAGRGWSAGRVALATLVVLAVALAFWLLIRLYVVLFIVFIAYVLSVAIRPAARWLHGAGVPRALSVALIYVVAAALILALVLLVAPFLAAQVADVVDRLPGYYHDLITLLVTSRSALLQRLALILPGQPTVAPAAPSAEQQAAQGVAELGQLTGLLGRILLIGMAILVLAFYWTLDGERTLRSLLLRLPAERRDPAREIIAEIEGKVGAYLRGLLTLSSAVGIAAFVAYAIIGLPNPIVLGIIAGAMEAVPVVGPVLGAIPPALLALSVAPSKLIWVILATVLIQQLEGSLLVPRVMDRSVGVNPLVTILALIAFGGFFGIGGAFMAIPLAAVVQIGFNQWLLRSATKAPGEPEGRGLPSVLRYQVQEFIADMRRSIQRQDDSPSQDRLRDELEAIAEDLESILAEDGAEEARAEVAP